jgi:Ca2+/Na+ antiporter
MALGSSAPEILLAVLETCTSLGKCPGELGASTIVGSASFNLLVISGLSIYAVSPENDNLDERDEEMEKGVKRIYDMRVFAITCTSSLWAYIWLWSVLMDQYVKLWEGVLTFVFFFILIVLAFGADKVTAREAEKKSGKDAKDDVPVIEYSAYEIYKDLLIEQRGGAPQDEESIKKRDKMKRFLKQTMNTE